MGGYGWFRGEWVKMLTSSHVNSCTHDCMYDSDRILLLCTQAELGVKIFSFLFTWKVDLILEKEC